MPWPLSRICWPSSTLSGSLTLTTLLVGSRSGTEPPLWASSRLTASVTLRVLALGLRLPRAAARRTALLPGERIEPGAGRAAARLRAAEAAHEFLEDVLGRKARAGLRRRRAARRRPPPPKAGEFRLAVGVDLAAVERAASCPCRSGNRRQPKSRRTSAAPWGRTGSGRGGWPWPACDRPTSGPSRSQNEKPRARCRDRAWVPSRICWAD